MSEQRIPSMGAMQAQATTRAFKIIDLENWEAKLAALLVVAAMAGTAITVARTSKEPEQELMCRTVDGVSVCKMMPVQKLAR